jgi:antitoxin (DNA-binding transcriptional repressor) of toxin-antitoxin stability system
MSSSSLLPKKNRLSVLIDRAAQGEEFVITRAGKPVARIMALPGAPGRRLGAAKQWKDRQHGNQARNERACDTT